MKNLYENTAHLYDLSFRLLNDNFDIDYYQSQITDSSIILEVGCGTGRVALELVKHNNCRVFGIDLSESMLNIIRQKIIKLPTEKQKNINLKQADLKGFNLHTTFSHIILPFRIFQHLTNDEDILLAFSSLKKHMNLYSKLFIHVFEPNFQLLKNWKNTKKKDFSFTIPDESKIVERWTINDEHDIDKQIIKFHYEFKVGNEETHTYTDYFEMLYLYPNQIEKIFIESDFKIEHIEKFNINQKSNDVVYTLKLKN
jgi:cyclopropane fatty-acyl-phospholipid synthase-like methyltransferase